MTKTIEELRKDDEFIRGILYAEKKFADWLKKLIEIDYITGHIHREQYFIENIKAKEKQLRSKENKPFKKSLEGKDK